MECSINEVVNVLPLNIPSDIESASEHSGDSSENNDNEIDSIDGCVTNEDNIEMHIEDELDGEEDEEQKSIKRTLRKWSEEIERYRKEILAEKEMIAEEMKSYKEIKTILNARSKNDDDVMSVRSKGSLTCRERMKRLKQMDCVHHMHPKASQSSSQMSLSMVPLMMDVWFFKKCLKDAEKLCDVELERVRKCISVSSIHSMDNPTRCSMPQYAYGGTYGSSTPFYGRPMSSGRNSTRAHTRYTSSYFDGPQTIPESGDVEERSSNCLDKREAGDITDDESTIVWSSRSNTSTMVTCLEDATRSASPNIKANADVYRSKMQENP